MEKQTADVVDELKRIETNIGKNAVDCSQVEINEAKKQIQRMSTEIEEALNNYGKISKGDVLRAVEQVYDQMNKMVGDKILSTRHSEYLETRHNLTSIAGDKEVTSEDLEDFKQNGIVNKDKQYEKLIEDVCYNLTSTFKRKFQDARDRKSEDTVYDITRSVKKTGNFLVDIHGEYSEKIKKEILEEIETIGIKVNGDLENKLEDEIWRIGEKHGLIKPDKSRNKGKEIESVETGDKIEKSVEPHVKKFNDFAKSLCRDVEGDSQTIDNYKADLEKDKKTEREKRIEKLGENIPKL